MIQQPRFLAIGGASGTGKTSLRKRLMASGEMDGYHIYTDDDLLYQMREYHDRTREDFYGARKAMMGKVWEITDPALEQAMQNGLHILYDRTCSREINFNIMQKAKALGYYVEMQALSVNSLASHLRIAQREWKWEKGELHEMHGVTPQDQEMTEALFARIFFDYAYGTENAQPLDKVNLWDTEKDMRIIAQFQEGQLVEIYDEQKFERFKACAESVNPNANARRAAMRIYVR